MYKKQLINIFEYIFFLIKFKYLKIITKYKMLSSASTLYDLNESVSEYFKGKKFNEISKIKSSTTLYIGNLSFYTLESKIFNLFSQCGVVKKVIMGLNKETKFPCGFCFVEYYLREHAMKAVNILNYAKLDNRIIRVDWDVGFEEGRQYGRGFTGGQKRDEFMKNYDPDRPRNNYSVNHHNNHHSNYREGEKYNNYNKNYSSNKHYNYRKDSQDDNNNYRNSGNYNNYSQNGNSQSFLGKKKKHDNYNKNNNDD